jgi:hypothetical protein
MTIIGQIKENVKGDSKKQKLYREFEKLILQLAFEGVMNSPLPLRFAQWKWYLYRNP